jgi:hypothetical protein
MADSAVFKVAPAKSDHIAVPPRAPEPPVSARASRRPAGEPLRPSQVPPVLQRSGQPLAAPVKEEMEARLGADLSDVRIHADSAARASAAEVSARAYTSGSHIVIGDGGADKHILAHELTHVIQQRQGPVDATDNGNGLRVSDPSDRFESEAEANAHRALAGPAAAPGQVQRAVPAERNIGSLSRGRGPVVQRSGRGRGGRGGRRASGAAGPGQVPPAVIAEIADTEGREETYAGGEGKKIAKSRKGVACWEWAVRAEEESGGLDRGHFWDYLGGWDELTKAEHDQLESQVSRDLQKLLGELQKAGMSKGFENLSKKRAESKIKPFMQRSVEIFVEAHGFRIAEDDPAGWIVCHYRKSGAIGAPEHWWIELPTPEGERVLIQTVPDIDFFEAGDLDLRWNDEQSVEDREGGSKEYVTLEVPVVALKEQHIEVLEKVLKSKGKRKRS